MKTISEKTTVHAIFKKTQLLPMLTPDMIVRNGGAGALQVVWPRTKSPQTASRATQRSATPRLPRPLANESAAERVLFGLLMMSAAVSVGQALVTMIKLSPNWPMFNAWVAQLLG